MLKGRTRLKDPLTKENQQSTLLNLDTLRADIVNIYDNIKLTRPPKREEVQKVDCVTAITQEIQEVAHKLNALPDFNPETVKFHVRTHLCKETNPSVFGNSETETQVTHTSRSQHRELDIPLENASCNSEAVANLAAKNEQMKALKEIQAQRRRLKEEEEKLAVMQAMSEVKIAETHLMALKGCAPQSANKIFPSL